MQIQWWLTVAVSVLSVLSGVLWIRSATARVLHDSAKRDELGMMPMAIIDHTAKGNIDVLATAKLQSKWNTRAAWCAGAAALLQASSSVFQLGS